MPAAPQHDRARPGEVAITFDQVIAQPGAVRTLRRALETDRLASSYLFVGPTGVGKERTALALGQALVCPERPRVGCGRCGPCHRVAAEAHPDVRLFRPRDDGNRNIQVDVLRQEILPVAQYAPFEGPAALLVFPDADVSFPEIHAQSANALLKTLEEPRANVHFALLTSRPDRLLPTIRSRTQRVRFHRLPDQVLDRILREHGVGDEGERAAAIALADGRADRALALAEEGGSDALLEQAIGLDRAAAAGGPGDLLERSEALARSPELGLVLQALQSWYRDVARQGLGVGFALAFPQRAEDAARRARTLGPEPAAARVGRIVAALDDLERNANPQVVLDALLFSLRGTGVPGFPPRILPAYPRDRIS